MNPRDDLRSGLALSRHWAVAHALPLWASAGFNAREGLFEEQLSFAGEPVADVPRRVMVQARQISVYCLAARLGWFDGRAMASAAGESLIERFQGADGQDGWIFSLSRDGSVADPRRDLYAHAFVLFALAWLLDLLPEARVVPAIEHTLHVLDTLFADALHGGFWDTVPRSDRWRRQNPHMHLLEAFLQLFDATGDRAYLTRARGLVALATKAFIEPRHGALREVFDDRWQVAPASKPGSVEPGHQFEWAWLLRRYDRMTGEQHDRAIHRLVHFALDHGTHRPSGRIIDEIGEDTAPRRRSSRLWPHAESLKSLSVESLMGRGDFSTESAAILKRLQSVYCPTTLRGGWIDQVSDSDAPVSVVMPASSLYHIMFALKEASESVGPAPSLGGGA